MYYTFVLALVSNWYQVHAKVQNIPRLCEVLFNSETECPSPVFIKEDLVCFIEKDNLSGSQAKTLESINRSKKRKLSACEKWTKVIFFEFQGHKCIRDYRSNVLPPPLTTNPMGTEFAESFNITLYQACKEGNLGAVKYILAQGLEDINSPGKKGRTPVMVAAGTGQVAVFDFLVNQGCSLTAVDDSNDTVLNLACMYGNTHIVRRLLESGECDIERRGFNGWMPVLIAAFLGHIQTLKILIDKGCNLNVTNKRGNILHEACIGGQLNMIKYILSQTLADIESGGFKGWTPVMAAANKGNTEVVKFLQHEGCNMKVVGHDANNVLHAACMSGNVDMVKYILSQNIVGIESPGYGGLTPVMIAAHMGLTGVVKLLMHTGCNVKAVSPKLNNILHLACFGNHVEMVKYLLSQNIVSADSRAAAGRTPVMIAAYLGHIELVHLFISEGCDMAVLDRDGNNILHIACLGGHVDMLRYLISTEVVKCMAKKNNRYGQTPEETARRLGHLAVVSFLKERTYILTKGEGPHT